MLARFSIVLTVGIALLGCASETPEPSKQVASTTTVRPQRLTPIQLGAYRQHLSQMLARNAVPLLAAGGTKAARLDGFGNVTVAKVGADGAVTKLCVDDVDDAMRFLDNSASSAAGLEER